MARLAILDDDALTSDRVGELFRDLGHEVTCFANLDAFTTYLADHPENLDLVICERDLPDGSGLSVLNVLREHRFDAPLILISAASTGFEGAEALQAGAFDYVTKPLNLTELEVIGTRAIKLKALERSLLDTRANREHPPGIPGFVGDSPRVRDLFEVVHKVADTTSNILICGESGTGKELIARAIHAGGRRAQQNFVAVNCSAIPQELLESELFGYRRGAFTGADQDREGMFAEADGGTLFLDEIGDMPPLLQAKLLRVLQDRMVKRLGDATSRVVDVRIIAATHRDLKRATERREFREDLFFRLCVIKITTPPLRDRREDIPLLASHFLRAFSEANRKVISGFTRAAMDALIGAPWPGNVRELENTIERAVTLCGSHWIDDDDLGLEPSGGESGGAIGALFTRFPTLKQLEREYIRHVLNSTGGKKEDVAAILGIDRKTLYRKEREYFHRPT